MNMNPFDLFKNAQKMQEQMAALQDKLGDITVTGSSGAGMAEIDINGKMEVLAVRIAPEAAGDIEMLQDLIMAAFTDGMTKARDEIARETSALAGGLGLQGLNIPDFPG